MWVAGRVRDRQPFDFPAIPFGEPAVNQRPSSVGRFAAARFHQGLDSSPTIALAPAVVMTANSPTSHKADRCAPPCPFAAS